MKNISIKLCECECGRYASPGKRFISGHNSRKGRKIDRKFVEKMLLTRSLKHQGIITKEKRFCKCKCGETFVCFSNSPKQYIRGHQRKNATHSDESKKKIRQANLGRKMSKESTLKKIKATKGRKNPHYNRSEKVIAAGIKKRGRKLEDYHKPLCLCCVCKAKRGETRGVNNAQWRGGPKEYSSDFTSKLKALIRERDGYTCQLCSRIQRRFEARFVVHHIDYSKENSDPINLITLCRPCHGKVNAGRSRWTEFFKLKLKLVV